MTLTRRDLTRRRFQIYRDLRTTPEALDAKAGETGPLTDAEFSAIYELREIGFLLGPSGSLRYGYAQPIRTAQ